MNLRRLSAVMVKELRQLRRDRVTLAMIVGIPLMQLVLFGYAINLNLRGLSAGIADQANTAGSRAVVMDLLATGVIRADVSAVAPQAVHELLRRGEISVGVVIPPDFERRRIEGREAVQVLVDGSDTVVQSAAIQLAQMPLDNSRALGNVTGLREVTPAQISVVSFYNPERRSEVNIVPGLIGVILTMTMVLFTGVAIVRERERGNLELLITTPVTRGQLMAGKLLPYVVIGLIQTTLILLLGWFLFAVPVAGSLVDLYLGALLFIAASLSLGLFISTLAQTQFQAMQMALLTLLPSILMSGFMFPFEGMPEAAQAIAQVLPLTHFNEIIRGIVLRGARLTDMQPEIAKQAAFLGIMLTLAVARFRKRLD